METEEKIIVGVCSVLLVLVVFCGYFAVKFGIERQEWLDSHCKKIGQISGSSSVGTGIGVNGNVSMISTYIPSKTGYKCDDGLEYWE